MNVEFLDTNVLLYAHDSGSGDKYLRSAELIKRLEAEDSGAMSIQVLSEFYNAATRKLSLSSLDAEAIIADFGHWNIHRPALHDLIRAAQLQRRLKLSWWDALIVNSAMALGCRTLWTEDLSHGQRIGSVVVRNPFRD